MAMTEHADNNLVRDLSLTQSLLLQASSTQSVFVDTNIVTTKAASASQLLTSTQGQAGLTVSLISSCLNAMLAFLQATQTPQWKQMHGMSVHDVHGSCRQPAAGTSWILSLSMLLLALPQDSSH